MPCGVRADWLTRGQQRSARLSCCSAERPERPIVRAVQVRRHAPVPPAVFTTAQLERQSPHTYAARSGYTHTHTHRRGGNSPQVRLSIIKRWIYGLSNSGIIDDRQWSSRSFTYCTKTSPNGIFRRLVRPTQTRNQGPDLQNILRQSYDYLTIMPKLRSTYDRRLIYKTSHNEWKAFHR